MKRNIVIAIFIIGIFVLLVRACFLHFSSSAVEFNNKVSKLDTNTFIRKAPEEYWNLFLNRNKLLCDSSAISKHQNPVSQFTYDGKYDIQVFKIDTLASLNAGLIEESFQNAELSLNHYYVQYFNHKNYENFYTLGEKEQLSNIHFSLNGDHTEIIKKSSTISCYYSMLKNFSIRYKRDGLINVYGKVKEEDKDSKIPVEMMFFNKNKNLYFIFLSAKNSNIYLDKYLLYNLIVGKQK